MPELPAGYDWLPDYLLAREGDMVCLGVGREWRRIDRPCHVAVLEIIRVCKPLTVVYAARSFSGDRR